ncbi:hypothetical protein [Bradyrhizobium roseum]|uniref:hypothetical protein n=1 Tax=Bradyrhizobium roseum TaxID=3056648 RepID=UPI002636B884|nr:hypothetical protein [Bradyrhizobium roseus]WKA30552.1 hypothetical protein QUH67_10460 [Bradyrhizobium roseus]
MDADTARLDTSERERLLNSLETAITGVENFSQRRGGIERLSPPSPDFDTGQPRHGPTAVSRFEPIDARSRDFLVPNEAYPTSEIQVVEVRSSSRVPLVLSTVAVLFTGAALGLSYYHEPLARLSGQAGLSARPGEVRDVAPPPASEAPAPAAPKPPGLPKPGNYGVYALNGDTLSELSLVMERAPDKRIAMSTPIGEPSRTRIADGRVRFILFRRDLVGNAPERIDVRVVARVVRALKFDSKGKPNFTSVPDSWNIRNISHELRVRPVPENPEMLLVQSENPDFELSPGRYVLVLKDQPYDFTVEGKITDAAQCLERTDAMNGSFYSECQKP